MTRIPAVFQRLLEDANAAPRPPRPAGQWVSGTCACDHCDGTGVRWSHGAASPHDCPSCQRGQRATVRWQPDPQPTPEDPHA
ncbi:hypothetical protein [Deinococcus sonorensis]|uniref:Uncharacterized protein n=1 Tax=Deinococcus sonorensis TaxID=309891 RepID=A0ABV8YBE3_9DEIO